MTVWTPVTLDEANEWLTARGFGRACALMPIADGVEDSVFRLDLESGTPVFLRLFERLAPEGVVMIAARLASAGLPTCPPLGGCDGRYVAPLKAKPAALYPWVEGDWISDPSLAQIRAIGEFLGRMARAGAGACRDVVQENPRGWEWFTATAEHLFPLLAPEEGRELADEVALHRNVWTSSRFIDLPCGVIHADLFRNNVMWTAQGKLAAVIDWGFCATGWPLLFDLAIVANDWCLAGGSSELDPEKLDALMKGRCALMPLTKAEIEAWPLALRWAALRFYLSRLYDFHMPREGKKHDPNHFLAILRTRREKV